MRRALTLVELVVVLSVAVVVMAALYQFWVSATRSSVELEARVTVLARGQAKLAAIQAELQSARRVLHPAPGGPVHAGVTLVNGDGEIVSFTLEERRLVRTALATKQQTLVLDGIAKLECRVPAAPPGRDPGLVHVTLGLVGPRDRTMYLVTSARLRALDVHCLVDR